MIYRWQRGSCISGCIVLTTLLSVGFAFDIQAARNDINLLGIGRPLVDSIDDPAVQRFRDLSNELSVAMTPASMTAARTLGRSGVEIAWLNRITTIHNNAPYWQGQAGIPVVEGVFEGAQIPGALWLPTIEFRKGLPFSTELGVQIGHLVGSSMFTVGTDLKITLHESFVQGLPALAIRTGVSRLFGARDLDLLSGHVDFLVAGSIHTSASRWTPYASFGWSTVHANSQVLDETPYEIVDGEDQRGGPDGSLYSFPTVDWRDNFNVRITGGLRYEYQSLDIGYELAMTQFEQSDTLFSHGVRLGWRFY